MLALQQPRDIAKLLLAPRAPGPRCPPCPRAPSCAPSTELPRQAAQPRSGHGTSARRTPALWPAPLSGPGSGSSMSAPSPWAGPGGDPRGLSQPLWRTPPTAEPSGAAPSSSSRYDGPDSSARPPGEQEPGPGREQQGPVTCGRHRRPRLGFAAGELRDQPSWLRRPGRRGGSALSSPAVKPFAFPGSRSASCAFRAPPWLADAIGPRAPPRRATPRHAERPQRVPALGTRAGAAPAAPGPGSGSGERPGVCAGTAAAGRRFLPGCYFQQMKSAGSSA